MCSAVAPAAISQVCGPSWSSQTWPRMAFLQSQQTLRCAWDSERVGWSIIGLHALSSQRPSSPGGRKGAINQSTERSPSLSVVSPSRPPCPHSEVRIDMLGRISLRLRRRSARTRSSLPSLRSRSLLRGPGKPQLQDARSRRVALPSLLIGVRRLHIGAAPLQSARTRCTCLLCCGESTKNRIPCEGHHKTLAHSLPARASTVILCRRCGPSLTQSC